MPQLRAANKRRKTPEPIPRVPEWADYGNKDTGKDDRDETA